MIAFSGKWRRTVTGLLVPDEREPPFTTLPAFLLNEPEPEPWLTFPGKTRSGLKARDVEELDRAWLGHGFGLGLGYFVGGEVRADAAPACEPSPAELRREKELEARGAIGYGGPAAAWDDRVYMSVTGPRWRCCSNAFEDDHAYWCPA